MLQSVRHLFAKMKEISGERQKIQHKKACNRLICMYLSPRDGIRTPPENQYVPCRVRRLSAAQFAL